MDVDRFQPMQVMGKKRLRYLDDDGEDAREDADKRPSKRACLFIPSETLVSDGTSRSFLISAYSPQANPWLLPRALQRQMTPDDLPEAFKRLNIGYDCFLLFSSLPPEIRRRIWQHTWEHREVTIRRKTTGWIIREDNVINYRKSVQGRHLTDYFSRKGGLTEMTAREWGASYRALITDGQSNRNESHGENGEKGNHGSTGNPREPVFVKVLKLDWEVRGEKEPMTNTWSETKPPVSLYVNRESRHETLLHFEQCLGLVGFNSVWFNFDLEIFRFPLHNTLSLVLQAKDLARLRRVSIPEIAPPVRAFEQKTFVWDEILSKKVWEAVPDTDSTPLYDEFNRVWRVLRWKYPNLREITLEPFHQCKRYQSTKNLKLARPINNLLPSYSSMCPDQVDAYCHSCLNMQRAILRRFPTIGTDISTQGDINRILDRYNIVDPVHQQEQLVIGTVTTGRGREEDVVIKFTTAKNRDSRRQNEITSFNTTSSTRAVSSTKMKCLARSLERALGAPCKWDEATLEI